MKWLKFLSIHDVLTSRADTSDPTNSTAKGPQPPAFPLRQIKKKPEKRCPPLQPSVNLAPNLRFISVHDVLTDRQKNSDPTDSDK